MNAFRGLKYFFVWTAIAAGAMSLLMSGMWSFALPIYAFVLVPLIELLIPADPKNHEDTTLQLLKADWRYDLQLYLIVAVQVGMVVLMCFTLNKGDWNGFETFGKIWTTGIACGVLGINVAHELGHRKTWYEQLMSKILLLTSLYMHFFIEHNRGHHKHVSTPLDPASARKGEPLYFFWFRSTWGSYRSAWNIENKRLKKLGKPILSLSNEMLVYQILQVTLLLVIGFVFSWTVMLYFIAAAISGFLLLETVNYIEHYGLQRKQMENGAYESVKPHHSWNSDHVLGRLLLFELSRHSDHHYRAARKYQTLRHMGNSPQMPTGYPGMLVLSLAPPLFFWVMDRQIRRYENTQTIANA